MNTSFFGELLQTISERGRALLDRGRDRRGDASAQSETLVDLCEHLISGRGEASGVARARETLLQRWDRGAPDAIGALPGRPRGRSGASRCGRGRA